MSNLATIIYEEGYEWTPDIEKLLRKWKSQIKKRREGHNILARRFRRMYYIIEGPNVLLGAFVTFGGFSTFQTCTDPACEGDATVRLLTSVAGLIFTCLTSLNLFIGCLSLSEQHKHASDAYESLYRTIDKILNLPQQLRGEPKGTLQNISDLYDSIKDSTRVQPPSDADVLLEYNVVTEIPKNHNPQKPPEFDDVVIEEVPSTEALEALLRKKSIHSEPALHKNDTLKIIKSNKSVPSRVKTGEGAPPYQETKFLKTAKYSESSDKTQSDDIIIEMDLLNHETNVMSNQNIMSEPNNFSPDKSEKREETNVMSTQNETNVMSTQNETNVMSTQNETNVMNARRERRKEERRKRALKQYLTNQNDHDTSEDDKPVVISFDASRTNSIGRSSAVIDTTQMMYNERSNMVREDSKIQKGLLEQLKSEMKRFGDNFKKK